MPNSNSDRRKQLTPKNHRDICSMLSDIVDIFVKDPESDIPIVMLRGVWASVEPYEFVDPLPTKYLDDADDTWRRTP